MEEVHLEISVVSLGGKAAAEKPGLNRINKNK